MGKNFRSARSLVIESYTWTPSLETAGEVALSGVGGHERNAFCHLGIPNPDEPPRFYFLETTGIWRRELKVQRMVSLLAQHGVEIVAPPSLPASVLRDVDAFVAAAPNRFEALRDYCYGEARLGAGVAASLTYSTRHSHPDVEKYKGIACEYLRIAAVAFEMTKALIVRLAPPSIFTFNGRFAACLAIAEAARLRGVPVTYYETGATKDRYELFSEIPHKPAFVAAEIRRYWSSADPDAAAIAREYFRRKRAGDNSDWQVFVERQERGALPPRPAGRRHIVYFTSSDYETEYVGRMPHGLFPDQRAGVAHLARWASLQSDVWVTIREHPNSREVQPDDRAWLARIDAKNVQVVRSESPVDTYALMDSADVVITAGSTIGLEAAFAGRPSVLVEPAFYSGFGCAYEPSSVRELEALLAEPALRALPIEASIPAGYYLAIHGIPFRYFEPTSLYTGRFLGKELVYSPEWMERLRLTPLARTLWRRFRPQWISSRRSYTPSDGMP